MVNDNSNSESIIIDENSDIEIKNNEIEKSDIKKYNKLLSESKQYVKEGNISQMAAFKNYTFAMIRVNEIKNSELYKVKYNSFKDFYKNEIDLSEKMIYNYIGIIEQFDLTEEKLRKENTQLNYTNLVSFVPLLKKEENEEKKDEIREEAIKLLKEGKTKKEMKEKADELKVKEVIDTENNTDEAKTEKAQEENDSESGDEIINALVGKIEKDIETGEEKESIDKIIENLEILDSEIENNEIIKEKQTKLSEVLFSILKKLYKDPNDIVLFFKMSLNKDEINKVFE